MSEERGQILKMLAGGKIDVSEAERLLDAIGESQDKPETIDTILEKSNLKYLRVQVEPKNGGKTERRLQPMTGYGLI